MPYLTVCIPDGWSVYYARGTDDAKGARLEKILFDPGEVLELALNGPDLPGSKGGSLVVGRDAVACPVDLLDRCAMPASDERKVVSSWPLTWGESGDPGYAVRSNGYEYDASLGQAAITQVTVLVNHAGVSYEFRLVTASEEFDARLTEAMGIINSIAFTG